MTGAFCHIVRTFVLVLLVLVSDDDDVRDAECSTRDGDFGGE